ncbi:hypothetical protein F2Q68_00015508 [Brassica cretica]|uniref:Uncharacterized protein n=1 Tax=Brassica cretica TaxID=69181 RepID=A0A8S9HJT0_BRACR|nr:hypothetical protein F2Q68_00015508 [Brassica cretica]
MCNVEKPPPEPWVPMRPFSERVVGRPSRCTLLFLGTVRSFYHIPENVDFRLPLEGERADEPPEGFFTLYEEHMMCARLWFPIPSVVVEFLNRLDVSISRISPLGIKHLVGLLVLGYERGMELTADYLEAFLTLSRVGTDRLWQYPKSKTYEFTNYQGGRTHYVYSSPSSYHSVELSTDRLNNRWTVPSGICWGKILSDPALARTWSLSDRASARARSLRSDRAGRALGRYVTTKLWLELGRYVATELWLEPVATDFVQEIEFVAHFVDPSEADVYWVAMCNVEEPPPEPWVPMRPFSERVVGGPSRCTLPFLGTVHSFCHVPENVDFRLPLVGERADEPPEGFFTLYEEHLMRARLWFPIPSVIVEFLDRLEVSISQISPRGIKHLVRLLILGYERGMELTADYLEAFLTLSRVGTDRLLDQASVAVECLPSFRRLWVVGVHNPIPPFPEDLCIVRDLRGGPLFLGHFSPERVSAAVEAHRSRSSSSIDNDMGASFEDTSLPAVYATGQSSCRGSLDAEDDGEPTVEDPVSGR